MEKLEKKIRKVFQKRLGCRAEVKKISLAPPLQKPYKKTKIGPYQISEYCSVHFKEIADIEFGYIILIEGPLLKKGLKEMERKITEEIKNGLKMKKIEIIGLLLKIESINKENEYFFVCSFSKTIRAWIRLFFFIWNLNILKTI